MLQLRASLVGIAVVVAVVGGWVWQFFNYWYLKPAPLLLYLPNSLAYALAGVLALALVAKDLRHPAAAQLCLLLAGLVIAASAGSLVAFRGSGAFQLTDEDDRWPLVVLSVATIVVGAAFARFTVRFPRPREREEFEALAPRAPASTPAKPRRFGWFGLPWSAWHIAVPLMLAYVAASYWHAHATSDHAAAHAALQTSNLLMIVALPLFLGHGVLCFWKGYKLLDAPEQRQSDWIILPLVVLGLWMAFVFVAGVAAMFAVGFAAGISGQDRQTALESITNLVNGSVLAIELVIDSVVMLIVVAGLAFAMFRAGALEPSLVIRKTTLYGLLTIALSALFVIFEGIASALAVAHIGLPTQVGPAVAGATVAVLFNPMRRLMAGYSARLVDRLMPATALAEGARRACAVVFSDLTGYTGISARDERTALTLAAAFHKEARRAAGDHGGRVVKTIGDAVLMEFGDAAVALRACFALQDGFRTACETGGLPAVALRTGINSGEIVVAPDGDVFGSTVNVASRLEGIAEPGAIVLSKAAADELRGRFAVEAIGARTLKNVPEPVPCYRALALAGRQ